MSISHKGGTIKQLFRWYLKGHEKPTGAPFSVFAWVVGFCYNSVKFELILMIFFFTNVSTISTTRELKIKSIGSKMTEL